MRVTKVTFYKCARDLTCLVIVYNLFGNFFGQHQFVGVTKLTLQKCTGSLFLVHNLQTL